MATYPKHIIDKIIGNDGYDPPEQAVEIVEYENGRTGDTSWGVIYEGDRPGKYSESWAVVSPRTIWVWEGTKGADLHRNGEAPQGQ